MHSQPPRFDLLELAWWQYPHSWALIGLIIIILMVSGAYAWWLRKKRLRRPKTPAEQLRAELDSLTRLFTQTVPDTYAQQKIFYERATQIVHRYAHYFLAAPLAEYTDSELLAWLPTAADQEFVNVVEKLFEHGQRVKFAGQTVATEVVLEDGNALQQVVLHKLG